MEYVAFLLIGALAGFLAGLLGIGGGLVIVPALAFLLAEASPEHAMHLAVATSLATIVFTALSSVYAHHRHGAVNWPLMGRLTPGLLAGAAAGAWLASALPGRILMGVFGAFCLLTGARMWQRKGAPTEGSGPGTTESLAGGFGIGAVSAIVGIGGGTLTVPFLNWRGVSIHRAVATSAACGLPIALAGVAGFVGTGWEVSDLPAGTVGYVWLPAAVGISLASVMTAPLGARTAHRAPRQQLQRWFGSFLLLLGLYLIVRASAGW